MRWVFPLFLFQMPQDIQRQTHTVFYALFIKNLISLFRFCWVEDTITLRYFWVFGFTFDFLSFSFRLFRFVSVFPFWVWFDFLKTKKPITTTTNPKRKTSKKRYNFQLLFEKKINKIFLYYYFEIITISIITLSIRTHFFLIIILQQKILKISNLQIFICFVIKNEKNKKNKKKRLWTKNCKNKKYFLI